MKLRTLIFLALAALLLAACGAPGTTQTPSAPTLPQAPAATAAPAATLPPIIPVTPEPGKGALTGQITGTSQLWPDMDVMVYAAPFSRRSDGGGFYVLEPNKHPSVQLRPGGAFQLNNILPGDYVLVVGPEPGGARLVVDAQNQPRVFTVKEGEVQEVGKLELAK